MTALLAQPITAAAFAPFGQLISAGLRPGSSANQGSAERFDHCADLTGTRPGARQNLAVFRAAAKRLPLEMTLLERHPCSTQIFLPLICSRYLVCVAPTLPTGGPDLDGLKAFTCAAGQGIAYAVGTWHHPMTCLDTDAEFAMLVWEDGSPLDCELHPLAQPIPVREP